MKSLSSFTHTYHSKPVWLSFFCKTQKKDILKNVVNQIVSVPIDFHCICFLYSRACERSGAWSERGAERAKYSWSAERVFIQRPERSLCLAPVPLRYRSHHEPRACTNPPRIHLCLQQLTKLSAYTSKIVRCEGEMEFVKYFQKQTDRSHRCTIPVKKTRW